MLAYNITPPPLEEKDGVGGYLIEWHGMWERTKRSVQCAGSSPCPHSLGRYRVMEAEEERVMVMVRGLD